MLALSARRASEAYNPETTVFKGFRATASMDPRLRALLAGIISEPVIASVAWQSSAF